MEWLIALSPSVCGLVTLFALSMDYTSSEKVATEEKGPVTELNFGTYTLSQVQPRESQIPGKILCPPLP